MRCFKIIPLMILAGLCVSLKPVDFGRVMSVYDGDTILLHNRSRVRYLGINAPEIDHKGNGSEFMADAARTFNKELVQGARVRLEYDRVKKDRYKRILAYVFLENGEMVNALMVRKGFANVMSNRPNLRYRALFLDYQRLAMAEKLGIWRNLSKNRERRYLGSTDSFRFHRLDCPFAKRISPKNLSEFGSRYRAFWEGYSPCKRCRP